MSYSIKHNKQFQKFYISVGGREAFLKYEQVGEGTLDFKVLFVPKNLRGMGIAEKVLMRAISFAENNNYKIRSSCTYISTYFETHPEVKDMISQRPDMFTWVLHYN